jgi:hypothetical protein
MTAQDLKPRTLPKQGALKCVIGVNFREKGFYSSYTHGNQQI